MRLVEVVSDAWSTSDAEWTAAGKSEQVLTPHQVQDGAWRFGPWVLRAAGISQFGSYWYGNTLQLETAALETIAMGGLDGGNAGRGGTVTTPVLHASLGLRLAAAMGSAIGQTRIVRINDDCFRVDVGVFTPRSMPDVPKLSSPRTTYQEDPQLPPSTPMVSVLLTRRTTCDAYEYSLKVRQLAEQAETRIVLTEWFAPFAIENNPDDAVAYKLTSRYAQNGFLQGAVVNPNPEYGGYSNVLGKTLVWRIPFAHTAGCSGRCTSRAAAALVFLMLMLFLLALFAILASRRLLRGSSLWGSSSSPRSAAGDTYAAAAAAAVKSSHPYFFSTN